MLAIPDVQFGFRRSRIRREQNEGGRSDMVDDKGCCGCTEEVVEVAAVDDEGCCEEPVEIEADDDVCCEEPVETCCCDEA